MPPFARLTRAHDLGTLWRVQVRVGNVKLYDKSFSKKDYIFEEVVQYRDHAITLSGLNTFYSQVTGDLRDADAVAKVCKGADCVWHNAAAVGPFHPQELYMQVPS